MTTRTTKTTRSKRQPTVILHCPSCRAPKKCKAVGTGTIGRQRRELVMCLEKSCGLTWLSERSHIPPALEAA